MFLSRVATIPSMSGLQAWPAQLRAIRGWSPIRGDLAFFETLIGDLVAHVCTHWFTHVFCWYTDMLICCYRHWNLWLKKADLIQKINNGIRPHIFCARRTSNKGWVWLQFSSCQAVEMFQAAARNYDLTSKIGYPRLPIIHMDYPQLSIIHMDYPHLSPLQIAILSENHALFWSCQEQVRGLVQIQSSCCAFAALQEDGSVISWGHPSMPQKTAEFAESMIFVFFWLIFPI